MTSDKKITAPTSTDTNASFPNSNPPFTPPPRATAPTFGSKDSTSDDHIENPDSLDMSFTPDSYAIPPRYGMHRPSKLLTNPKHPDLGYLTAHDPRVPSPPIKSFFKRRKVNLDKFKTPEKKFHVRPDGTPRELTEPHTKKSPESFGHGHGWMGFQTPSPPKEGMVTPGSGYRADDDSDKEMMEG